MFLAVFEPNGCPIRFQSDTRRSEHMKPSEATSQGSPHLPSQIQAVPVLSPLCPFLISFSSFTLTGFPLLDFPSVSILPFLPCSHRTTSQVPEVPELHLIAIAYVAHREFFFSKSYQINSKSDCIYLSDNKLFIIRLYFFLV